MEVVVHVWWEIYIPWGWYDRHFTVRLGWFFWGYQHWLSSFLDHQITQNHLKTFDLRLYDYRLFPFPQEYQLWSVHLFVSITWLLLPLWWKSYQSSMQPYHWSRMDSSKRVKTVIVYHHDPSVRRFRLLFHIVLLWYIVHYKYNIVDF